jgi:hypothetical protein
VEEVKQLLARDTLKPRTYRIGANRTVYVGGVARFDVHDFDYGTVYLTVWASDLIPLHMGKTQLKNTQVRSVAFYAPQTSYCSLLRGSQGAACSSAPVLQCSSAPVLQCSSTP